MTDFTGILNLNIVNSRSPGCRTTDVEGTHGQLGTRLTDRLCSNNTDRLTRVNQVTATQITTVTLRAQIP